jgi:hypothetical protein
MYDDQQLCKVFFYQKETVPMKNEFQNGYGVMLKRQHPGIPSCTSAGCVLQPCKVS